VQRDAASDGMARAGAQPKWKSSSRVRPAGQDARFSTSQRGFESRTRRQNPKSRVRSRRATQTGRNDWAAPEPVTGTFLNGFVNSAEECLPVWQEVAGSIPARGASFST
jgi:hypothetical protein